MRKPRRRLYSWMGILAKVAVSGLVFGLLITHAHLEGIGNSIGRASLAGLAPPAVALLAVPMFGGLRWWLALRGLGGAAPLGSLTVWFSTATVAGQVLPSIAGDGVRVWLATRRGVPFATTFHSILLERVFMVLTLLVLALATAPLLHARTGEPGPELISAMLLLAGLGGLAVLMFADRLGVLGLGRLRPWRALMTSAPGTRRLVVSRWGGGLAVASLASNLNFALAGLLLARALGLPVTILDMLAIMPVVTLGTTLPVSLGGWGVREGLLVLLLGHIGVASADGLALSLLFGAGSALGSVPGMLVQVVGERLTPGYYWVSRRLDWAQS